ncbi:cytochrome P450 [Panaeolus papilionaceus]|nr:cytochrome P450 [Panaeolus papilionaceus]
MDLMELGAKALHWIDADGDNTSRLLRSLAILLVYHGAWSYYRGETRRLSHIPTAGYSLPFLSFFSSLKFLVSGSRIMLNGRNNFGSIFKVPELTSWLVVVADRNLMEEIRKAPESVLSQAEFLDDFLQGPYTFGSATIFNGYHIPLIRGTFTKSIPLLFPEVYLETIEAFQEIIPQTEDWTKVNIQDTTTHIVGRISNRTFVGKPLCQNKEYVDLNVKFANGAVMASLLLRLVPSYLKPLLNYFISDIPNLLRRNTEFVGPIIHARRQAMLEKGVDYEGKPMDLLSWLIDLARGDDATDEQLTLRMLFVNFGAIHTSSMSYMHAIFHLASNQSYVDLLRAEVDEVIGHYGWTMEAINMLVTVDSFLKECQRLHPVVHGALLRRAMQDFTFSNGVTIPRGTLIGASIPEAHRAENVYSNPNQFDPLRYLKLATKETQNNPESKKKYDITSVGLNSLIFGYGRHACPGRFFAAVELKLMLAYVVTHYDIKLEKEGKRPADISFGLNLLPNPFASVLFRKRR